jgi:hypothetical protein
MNFYSYISLCILAFSTLPVFAEKEKAATAPTISGVVKVEAGFSDGSRELNLAVEVGFNHSFNDKVESHVLVLYEGGEHDDNIAVEEAIITLHLTKNISIIAGRQSVPFGQFDSNMLSDPLKEEAIQFALSSGQFYSAFYLFKNYSDFSEKMDDFGLSLDYESEAFATGMSLIFDVKGQSNANHTAKGVSFHAKKTIGRTTLIVEHLQVSANAVGKKPQESNLELSIDIESDRMLTFSVQKTKNATDLDLPKKTFGIVYSMPIYDKVELTTEVMKTKTYDGSNNTAITLQLGYEF